MWFLRVCHHISRAVYISFTHLVYRALIVLGRWCCTGNTKRYSAYKVQYVLGLEGKINIYEKNNYNIIYIYIYILPSSM